MAEPMPDVSASEVSVRWRAHLRAGSKRALQTLVKRLAAASGVELEILAAARYWKDPALFVAELRHREEPAAIPDLLWTVLQQALTVGGPWTVSTATDDDFEILASLNGGSRMTVPGIEMVVITTMLSDSPESSEPG